MAYLTNSDIEQRLGSAAYIQLTDDAGTGSANEAVVDAARVAAEGEVDSYFARRHRVPIDLNAHPELSGVLAAVTLDIAEYRLNARRPPVPEDVTSRYQAALIWLAQVAAGQVVLPSVAVLPGNDATGLRAASTGDRAILSRATMEGI